MSSVEVGELPGESGVLHPTYGSRTTLTLLITKINSLAASAFSGYHSAPVIPEAAFTLSLGTIVPFWAVGVVAMGGLCVKYAVTWVVGTVISRAYICTYEVIRTTNKQLG